MLHRTAAHACSLVYGALSCKPARSRAGGAGPMAGLRFAMAHALRKVPRIEEVSGGMGVYPPWFACTGARALTLGQKRWLGRHRARTLRSFPSRKGLFAGSWGRFAGSCWPVRMPLRGDTRSPIKEHTFYCSSPRVRCVVLPGQRGLSGGAKPSLPAAAAPLRRYAPPSRRVGIGDGAARAPPGVLSGRLGR